MIKSIHIDNFKALNNATIDFTPLTVLIGDNSVGKTTVLQAVAFLKYCCNATFDKFLDERKLTVSEICSKFSNKKTISFSTILCLNDQTIQWDLSLMRSKDRLVLNNERIIAGNETVLQYSVNGASYRLNAKTGKKDSVMEGSFSSSIVQFTDLEKQKDIYPVLASVKTFFYNMETLDLLSPYNMKGSSQGESDVIGLSGEKLGSFIKRMPVSEREELAKDVRKFVKTFSAVIPKTKQYGWVHLEAKETYNGKSIDVSSPNISDGILRIIALCSLRFLKNTNGAILLDEIEDGINNEHLELLVQVLREIQQEKNVQIIATTHNTMLLDYWIDKRIIDLNEEPDIQTQKESVVFLCRGTMGDVIAKDILTSEIIRDKLTYMFPGEVIQNMTNSQLREALL